MEIKSPATGILKIFVKENENIIKGQIIGTVNNTISSIETISALFFLS